jgi:hypothetical protein
MFTTYSEELASLAANKKAELAKQGFAKGTEVAYLKAVIFDLLEERDSLALKNEIENAKIKIDKPTVTSLKKTFEADPELQHLAPHIEGGVEILDYAFKAMDAAQTVKAPAGIELGAVEVRAIDENDEKAVGEVAVALWMLECISKQLLGDTNEVVEEVQSEE